MFMSRFKQRLQYLKPIIFFVSHLQNKFIKLQNSKIIFFSSTENVKKEADIHAGWFVELMFKVMCKVDNLVIKKTCFSVNIYKGF